VQGGGSDNGQRHVLPKGSWTNARANCAGNHGRTEMCRAALHKACHCKVFDISQSFTYGRPDRHVHLEFPAGMQQEYGKNGNKKRKYLN
jgi:hypothetical protein